MADLVEETSSTSSGSSSTFKATGSLGQLPFHADGSLSKIDTDNKMTLYPLYGTVDSDNCITIPVAPSSLMFNEDSDSQTIKLINYGELPISMNRKLATWSISSFFPKRFNKTNGSSFKYWFDVSDGTGDPYSYYCKKILDWKNNQTPLVFAFDTWGTYYNCQIKGFKYGRQDWVGNIYYELDFQEYKEYTQYDSSATTSKYSSDTYYPGDGETFLQVIKKLYGSTSAANIDYFMNLNSLTTPTVTAGKAYKVR